MKTFKTEEYIYIVQVTRQLTIDILNTFLKEGKKVHLITGAVETNYQPLDAQVKITSLIRYNNTSPFNRLFTWTWFTVCAFFVVLFSSRKKEMILVTTPPFIVFLGWLFKKIRGQKYHLVIWDLYPDVLINFNALQASSRLARAWASLNRKCFDEASTLLTLGKHLADAIKKYTRNEPVVVYNWANADFIKPIEKSNNAFLLKYQLTGKFVVMYSGNLGITHDIESIIQTAEKLMALPDIQFIVIGEGAKKSKIEQLVKDKKLTNVLLLPYQNKEMLPYSLAAADVGIITLGEGAGDVSVPSKTYSTLAAGSAVLALAPHQSELGLLIEKYNCGKIFSGMQIGEMADFIKKLWLDRELLNGYKSRSRAASADFTPENARQFYNAIHLN